MTYYDEEFKPWEIVGGQCVVADEAEWQKLATVGIVSGEAFCATQETDADIGNNERPIVKLTTDIFEDVEGPVVDTKGDLHLTSYLGDAFDSFDGLESDAKKLLNEWNLFVDKQAWHATRYNDVLTRFFQTVDSTPHVDYLIVTQRPELVREKWPYESETVTEQSVGRPEKHVVEVKRHFEAMPNIILATYVETQADIERLVPELLKCHDLCKGLAVVCNPKEKLDFREVNLGASADNYFYVDSLAGDWVQEDVGDRENPPSTMCHDDGPSLNLIIAEGNEHPIHPQWLRSLRDQCLDTNVPFNFAGWGAYSHRHHPPAGIHIVAGRAQPYLKIGKDKSGRLLDGQEHNGRL